MINYLTAIKKFDEHGDKTGWIYIDIPASIAQQINPNTKKSFRVKGKIDDVELKPISILPMGLGNFILPLNASLRKQLKKQVDEIVTVNITFEQNDYEINIDFVNCLQDEPKALQHFNTLTKSHKNYFSKWIEQAKTNETKTKRITKAIIALAKGWSYVEMIRDK